MHVVAILLGLPVGHPSLAGLLPQLEHPDQATLEVVASLAVYL